MVCAVAVLARVDHAPLTDDHSHGGIRRDGRGHKGREALRIEKPRGALFADGSRTSGECV